MKHELYDITLPPDDAGDPVVIGIYDDETDSIEWNVDPDTVRSVTSSTKSLDLRTALNTQGPVAFMRRGPNGAVVFELPVDETARALDEMLKGSVAPAPEKIEAEQRNGALERAMKILEAKGTYVVEIEGRVVDALGNARAVFSADVSSKSPGAVELVGVALRMGRFDPLGDVDDDGNYHDVGEKIVEDLTARATNRRSESFTLPSNPRRLTLWKRIRLLYKAGKAKG